MDNNANNVYAFLNAGKMLSRKKKVDSRLCVLERELSDADGDAATFISGKLAAVRDSRGRTHRKIIKHCVEVKKEIQESKGFNSETDFLEGYLEGLEYILNLDRDLFHTDVNFCFFLYSENEDLREKYQLALSAMKEFHEVGDKGIQYLVSGSIEEIHRQIMGLDSQTEYAILVVYNKSCLPSMEIMKALAAEKYDCVYLHKDNSEDNIARIITRVLKDTGDLNK